MMKKLLAVVVVMAIAVGAVVPVLARTGTASACEMGLTPGYWKNHTAVWLRYSTTEYFDVAFGVGPHQTLIDVLNTGGGKFDALNRHAVAALLNAARFGYPDFYSDGFIKYKVRYAYSSGDWQSVKDLLEAANELGG